MGSIKPLHKFNNCEGATICNNCRGVINLGFTDTLYCNKCKEYGKQTPSESKKEVRERGLDSDQHDKT
jgi:hypothetical protein